MSSPPAPPGSPPLARCQRCGDLIQGGCARCQAAGWTPLPVRTGIWPGLWDLPRAFALMATRPSLWPTLLIPVIINVVIWAAGLAGAILLYRHYADRIDQEYLRWAVLVGGVVVYLALAIVLFGSVGAVVAALFYEWLSDRTEALQAGRRPPGSKVMSRGLLAASWSAAVLAFWVLVHTVIWIWLPFVLPGVGALLYMAILAHVRAWEIMDFTLARKGYLSAERKALMRAVGWRAWTFSFLANLVLPIPIVGWFVFPAAVVAGANAYLEQPRR